jgi:hypothetical protein
MPDESPVLDQINLIVGDMPSMLEFYGRLGVTIPDTPPPWDRHHRSAEAGDGVDLDFDSQEFAATWNRGLPERHPRVVVGFRLASRAGVDQTYDDLTRAGYLGQQEPYDASGARATPSSKTPTGTRWVS